jgi:hypothetical protein
VTEPVAVPLGDRLADAVQRRRSQLVLGAIPIAFGHGRKR